MYNRRNGDRSLEQNSAETLITLNAAVTTDDASTIQEFLFFLRGRRPSHPQNPTAFFISTLLNWFPSGNGAEQTSATPNVLGFAATRSIDLFVISFGPDEKKLTRLL